jgi:hypothetical protein
MLTVHCNFSVDEGIEKSRRKVAQLTPIAPDPNSTPKFVFGLVQSINHQKCVRGRE